MNDAGQVDGGSLLNVSLLGPEDGGAGLDDPQEHPVLEVRGGADLAAVPPRVTRHYGLQHQPPQRGLNSVLDLEIFQYLKIFQCSISKYFDKFQNMSFIFFSEMFETKEKVSKSGSSRVITLNDFKTNLNSVAARVDKLIHCQQTGVSVSDP